MTKLITSSGKNVRTRRLEGPTAIVTGASRGIGLAMAKQLVAEGSRGCITAWKTEPLDKLAR
ncbi:SDR family NAD(P)-dependent oxidoreductase [Arthrobacter gengyunqii]|uniref:SDR family NAD(P)-dependent oxidoreductase n=1 Tax=Arthrobacter gengyunqii TaxID=2886940 RepID=UPI00311A9B3C